MRLNAFVDWIIRKMRMKPKSVEQLLLPMMISGWVTGRGIIEFPLGNRWPVASCIYSLMLVSVYLTVCKLALEAIDSMMESLGFSTGVLIAHGIICVFLCVDICNTLIGWTSIHGVKMIINRLEASGKKMEKLGIPQDYKFLYWRQSITSFGEIFYVIIMILLVYDWDYVVNDFWDELFFVIVSHYPIILTSIGDAAFITLVRYVASRTLWQAHEARHIQHSTFEQNCRSKERKQRLDALNLKFEQLNRALKQLSTTTDNSPQHKRVLERAIFKRHNMGDRFKKQTNDDPKLMRMALEDHYELVRIGSLINETFGTQALLSITFMFFFLVGLLWYASRTILWSDFDENDVRWFVLSLTWVAFGGYKIFNMTSACAKATNEMVAAIAIYFILVVQLGDPTRQLFEEEYD